MAKSYAHELGELIGVFFEEAMKRPIAAFASEHSLYFDSAGPRKTRKGTKVTWADVDGNRHDLDCVLERGGSDSVVGEPVAFIELAWRRYTKHSKNKVQEIYGAVNPIAAKYSLAHPFKGAILSGDFSLPCLEQLNRQGFTVLYIPFARMTAAFANHGLDVAFDESTSEKNLCQIVRRWKQTPTPVFEAIRTTMYETCSGEIGAFVSALRKAVDRRLKYIHVMPLHGVGRDVQSISDAIDYIQTLPCESGVALPLQYIEIVVGYDNGTRIEGRFASAGEAIDFLETTK